ncbi:MAG: hypothetical protein KDH92_12710 [Chloroflexi bacterium]|nr:hypothetical protein [Chloroflexota bacterium]
MQALIELRRILRYLFGKRSEIADLDLRDALMSKVVLDIHRKRIDKVIVRVPLFALRQIHRLDRENSQLATQQRVEALEAHRHTLLALGGLSLDTLARYLPSVSQIKVVEAAPDTWLAFEGNGRIAALQTVFTPQDGLWVEVEQYRFRNTRKIVRRLDRVRRMNDLLPQASDGAGDGDADGDSPRA